MSKNLGLYILTGITAALIISGCAPAARFTGSGAKELPSSGNRRTTPKQPARTQTKDTPPSSDLLTTADPSAEGFVEEGVASFYADKYNGRQTANGEIYNMYDLTAAHPTLPLGVKIKVTNLENGKTVILRVNDRMPQHPDRIIDLSYKAAIVLDFVKKGLARVRIEVIK